MNDGEARYWFATPDGWRCSGCGHLAVGLIDAETDQAHKCVFEDDRWWIKHPKDGIRHTANMLCEVCEESPEPIAPRVASASTDLRIGQFVIAYHHDAEHGWSGEKAFQLTKADLEGLFSPWESWTVVILPDPLPEPIPVSQAVLDRLAREVGKWHPGDNLIASDLLNAARAVVQDAGRTKP